MGVSEQPRQYGPDEEVDNAQRLSAWLDRSSTCSMVGTHEGWMIGMEAVAADSRTATRTGHTRIRTGGTQRHSTLRRRRSRYSSAKYWTYWRVPLVKTLLIAVIRRRGSAWSRMNANSEHPGLLGRRALLEVDAGVQRGAQARVPLRQLVVGEAGGGRSCRADQRGKGRGRDGGGGRCGVGGGDLFDVVGVVNGRGLGHVHVGGRASDRLGACTATESARRLQRRGGLVARRAHENNVTPSDSGEESEQRQLCAL